MRGEIDGPLGPEDPPAIEVAAGKPPCDPRPGGVEHLDRLVAASALDQRAVPRGVGRGTARRTRAAPHEDQSRRTEAASISGAPSWRACADGIAHPLAHNARNAEEATIAAGAIGFPVALKIRSPDVVHKSDVGGVILNLVDQESVREATAALLARVHAAQPEARIDGVVVQQDGAWLV